MGNSVVISKVWLYSIQSGLYFSLFLKTRFTNNTRNPSRYEKMIFSNKVIKQTNRKPITIMSESKKLTFGRRTWNRDEYKSTDDDKSANIDNGNSQISTKITLPMGLEKRIQRQYNLTSGASSTKKLISKKKVFEDNDDDNTDRKADSNSKKFKCYVCGYQFNNDLKLIEHWNTEKHIQKLTQTYNNTVEDNQEKITFPHDYTVNYKKDDGIIKQHLKYLQETVYKQ